MVIFFRNISSPTNSEIVEDLKETKMYSCNVKYVVKNTKGEYNQESKLYYCKEDKFHYVP